jgi:hypothetical protein
MVPRGGSAAFLAPRPLSLLAISVEVQHMLEALGVRTLGEFAALPAPSVARPLEADYRALARGESGAHLRPYAPEAAIREELMVAAGNVLDGADSLSGPSAIAQVARRIAVRLEGRGRGAARLELAAIRPEGTPEVVAAGIRSSIAHVEPHAMSSLTSAEDLARTIAPVLEAVAETTTTWRLRVTVVGETVTTMDEHDVATTTELAMPVRTFEPVVMARPAAAAAPSRNAAGTAQPVRAVPPVRIVRAANANETAKVGSVAASSRSVANSNHGDDEPTRAATPVVADPLAVVLSTSGTLFALSMEGPAWGAPDRGDRVERAHRRTRRGKQRRTRSMTAPVQARLFDRR